MVQLWKFISTFKLITDTFSSEVINDCQLLADFLVTTQQECKLNGLSKNWLSSEIRVAFNWPERCKTIKKSKSSASLWKFLSDNLAPDAIICCLSLLLLLTLFNRLKFIQLPPFDSILSINSALCFNHIISLFFKMTCPLRQKKRDCVLFKSHDSLRLMMSLDVRAKMQLFFVSLMNSNLTWILCKKKQNVVL